MVAGLCEGLKKRAPSRRLAFQATEAEQRDDVIGQPQAQAQTQTETRTETDREGTAIGMGVE